MANDLNNGQLELCKGWWKPTWGTSDYFNACNSNGIVDIPANFWGYQPAYEGNGYVGLGPAEWNLLTNEYSSFEYIQTKLIHPLVPCYNYHFEMKVSLGNYSKYAFTKLGALFTSNPISINDWNPIIDSPQVINSNGFLNDTLNWMTVGGDFEADGNEKYLCIGYFYNTVLNDTSFFQNFPAFPGAGYGYYYIDSVSVIEIGEVANCTYKIPNVFTPNNDHTNDLWEFVSSTEGHFVILNRWGNTVYQSDGYSFSWDGGDCVEGVYFYHFTTEKEVKTGFIELIR